MVAQGMKSSLVGIAMNLILALFKCIAGFIGHSFALVADGIESMSDVVSSSIVYLGLKFAIKPPDREHPYGHGKAEPVAAIIVSLALVGAALLIGIESLQRIRTPFLARALYPVGPSLRGCNQIAVVAVCLVGRRKYRQHRRAQRCMASPERRDYFGFCLCGNRRSSMDQERHGR